MKKGPVSRGEEFIETRSGNSDPPGEGIGAPTTEDPCGRVSGVEGGVRSASSHDLEACLEIVRSLEDHFTDDVPAKVKSDLSRHGGWVIEDHDQVVGFVVVDRRLPSAAEILWIAVAAARRNVGYGRRLLNAVLGALRDQGTVVVSVKTLDRSADYEPYEATNAFYERSGFVQIDCIDEPPDRPPGNPAAIYVAALQRTV